MNRLWNNVRHVYVVDSSSALRTRLFHSLVSQGFAVRLCSAGEQLIAGLTEFATGCIILDMVDTADCFDLISSLSASRPTLPVIAMTSAGDVVAAVQAMRAGAVDVIEKPVDENALATSVSGALRELDDRVRDVDRRAVASERLAALTARENEVLRGLSVGRSNKLLAFDFGISIRTVEMHRSSMMERLGVRTLAEALFIAFDAASGTNARHAA
ncbi:response regulator transcription factor [Polymorphobacter sp. PAMC 29334]|uniref:response regulator transcription factor n=1 Tax=Polymorphobacter sp. PAMC 29334 TaxID=2862331 RepID=UPI001D01D295|nr:response regulator [Polymorphobacter sp. PAMC 29334]